jgi:hypothetical protein
MKPITVYFEDSKMETLKKVKGKKTWHDFILERCIQEELQIYIWDKEFLACPISGLAVVIASSKEEAYERLKQEMEDYYWATKEEMKTIKNGPDEIHKIEKMLVSVSGKE